MNIRHALEGQLGAKEQIRLNDVDIDPVGIRAILINEVVPEDPAQDFYGSSGQQYLSTTIPLFQKAGLPVEGIADILRMGVYITNAVKTPKTGYTIEKVSMEESLAYLEAELALFPEVRVILLMGDVAKKMFNRIGRKISGRNPIPSGATYRLRATPFFLGNIRVIPSYILTGGNILIEKSKFAMAAEDIATMAELIRWTRKKNSNALLPCGKGVLYWIGQMFISINPRRGFQISAMHREYLQPFYARRPACQRMQKATYYSAFARRSASLMRHPGRKRMGLCTCT